MKWVDMTPEKREHLKANRRKWYLSHKEHCKAYMKGWRTAQKNTSISPGVSNDDPRI